MAWTANIHKEGYDEHGRLIVKGTLTDGEREFPLSWNVATPQPDDWFKENVQRVVADIEANDARISELETWADTVTEGELDLTPKEKQPTAEEVWFENYQELSLMQKRVDQGFLASDDEGYLALQATVKQDYLDEYSKYVR